MPIHEKLRKLRQNKHLSQQDIANKLHISQNSYSLIESGRTKIDEQRILQLAKILGVTSTELLTDDAINFYGKVELEQAAHIQLLSAENKELTTQLTLQLARKDEQITSLLHQMEDLLTLLKMR